MNGNNPTSKRAFRDVETGELIEFAVEQQRQFDALTLPSERKVRGHFGTPATIARFMAEMFTSVPTGCVKILDPGAGVGTLSAAVCERLLSLRKPRNIFIELWENDPALIPFLEKTMRRCQTALQEAGHELDFVIVVDDFILANSQQPLFGTGPTRSFHLAILNPPYFKLRKESVHAQAMKHLVHGQPNIYALFMAAAADRLLPHGELIAITPRSYFNGPYFKRFRKWFFERMTVRRIHLFESRTEAFKNDAVLQENVILHAEKQGVVRDIVVTSSLGRELCHQSPRAIRYDQIIDDRQGDSIVRVTTNRLDCEILNAMDSLPCQFRNLGFEISTGPVVTFRTTRFLRHERAEDTAPLLWMHNVRPFVTQFPPKNGKPTHITVGKSSRKLLLPSRTYVLLKRFTAKEEKRRLVAGIMTSEDCYSEWVGLENHLNYIYKNGSELSDAEAFGLAAFFNSALVDRYFRAISGNTQVNASEIRAMPVPSERTLKVLGNSVKRTTDRSHARIEEIVGQSLDLPPHLIEQLIEAN